MFPLICRSPHIALHLFSSARIGTSSHQHSWRPCRASLAESAEQMHLKALIFDCDGEAPQLTRDVQLLCPKCIAAYYS